MLRGIAASIWKDEIIRKWDDWMMGHCGLEMGFNGELKMENGEWGACSSLNMRSSMGLGIFYRRGKTKEKRAENTEE